MYRKRKIFDIKRGHYIILEDDSTSQDTTQSTENDSKETSTENKSIETNADIQAINSELADVNKKYDEQKASENDSYAKNKQTQTNLLNSAMSAVKDAAGEYDNVQTNKDVLTAKSTLNELELKHTQAICKIELDHAQSVYNLEKKRIDVLRSLTNESYIGLPGKYKHLNESNVHNAKIYLDVLVGEDQLITSMPDFKNAFKDSELVYGKDKKGYYCLCIDREDFEKLYAVMNQVGYGRDDVFSVVMSQVLDRSQMINTSSEF